MVNRISDYLIKIPVIDSSCIDDFIYEKIEAYISRKYRNPLPELVAFTENLFFLRKAFGKNISVYEPTKTINDLINDTEVEFFPLEPPKIFQGAFLVEAKKQPLFDSVVGIGGYPSDNKYILLFAEKDVTTGNIFSLQYDCRWDGHKITDDFKDWGYADSYEEAANRYLQHGIKYLVTLSLMLESENTPLEIVRDKKESSRAQKQSGQSLIETKWSYKTIYVSFLFEQQKKDYEKIIKT